MTWGDEEGGVSAMADVDGTALARLLVDLPDVVIVTDATGCLVWANRAAEDLFGRPFEASRGLRGLDLVHPDDLELVHRSLASIVAKEVGAPIEVRFTTPRGWRLLEVVGSPVRWLRGDAVLFVLRDLTDRRRFEVARGEDARAWALVQHAAALTFLVSPDGVVESLSGAVTRRLGHDPELVEGRPLADLVEEADRPAVAAALVRAADGATTAFPVTAPVRLLLQGGRGSVPYELAVVNLTDDPTVGGYVVSGHDISARHLAEYELRKAHSLLTATLDATTDGVLVVGTDGRFTSFNRRFVELWRLPESIVVGRDDTRARTYVLDQLCDPGAFESKIDELYAHPEAESVDVLAFRDGRTLERHSLPQWVDGEVVGRVWTFRDVTDRRRLQDQLAYASLHDALTGLGNRALLLDRLQHGMARLERTGRRLAVLVLDLDDLTRINDGLGSTAGDLVLRVTAERLLASVRAADSAARLGSDEFGIVLEDLSDPAEAVQLAERLLDQVRRPVRAGDTEIVATATVGIAVDEDGLSGEQLLAKAGLALTAGKLQGGNRCATHGVTVDPPPPTGRTGRAVADGLRSAS